MRITNKEGQDVRDLLDTTILTLEIRQDPNHKLSEMFKGLQTTLQQNIQGDYKAGMNQPPINSLGQ